MLKIFSPTAKQRKWIVGIIALWSFYTLAGFVLLPAVLRYKMPDLIRAATGREGSVSAVIFDPYAFDLRLQDFEMKEKNGAPFVKFADFYADFNVWRSLRKGLWSFAELSLVQPYVHIGRQHDGTFNFADLLKPSPENKHAVQFEVVHLQLSGGKLDWHDEHYPQPVNVTVRPLDLEIHDLITRRDRESGVQVSLALKSGAKLAWNGKLTLRPLSFEGHLHIQGLQNQLIWKLLLQDRKVMLTKGVDEIDTQYRFDFNNGLLQVGLAPLQITADGFALKEPGDAVPLIDLQKLVLSDARVDVEWRQSDGRLHVKVPQGTIQIDKFAMTEPGSQKQRLDIEKFTLFGLNVDYRKQDVLQLSAAHEKIEVKNTSFELRRENPLKVSASDILVGMAQFKAWQSRPGAGLEMTALQDGINLKQLSIALPATRKTLLDVAKVALSKLQFALQPRLNAPPEIQVTQDSFAAKTFVLRDSAQKEPLAEVDSVTMGNMQFDLEKKSVQIASVESTGADIKAWLDSDGMLNYQTLFVGNKAGKPQVSQPVNKETVKKQPEAVENEPDPANAPTPQTNNSQPHQIATGQIPSTASPWTVAVGKLALHDGTLDFQDRSRKPPAAFQMSGLEAGIENFNTVDKEPFPLHFAGLFNDQGKIKLQGKAALQPINAALDISVEKFPLPPFQPYINPFVRLDITDGAIHMHGKLTLDLSDRSKPQVSFKGETGISDFHSREQTTNKDFAKWDEVILRGVAFDLQPLKFSTAEVQADRPFLRVAIDPERNSNLGEVIIKAPAKAAPVPQPVTVPEMKQEGEKKPALAFEIKKIKLRQGSSDFSDFSLIIPFDGRMANLNGTLDNLSSRRDAEAKLRLRGELLGQAPVGVKGTFYPYRGESAVWLSFRNIPLPAVTPYTAEFAGYRIERGKMDLDLNYEIDDGRLRAGNKIFIDNLVLGEKVESPSAVDLPLKLAVALLKDTQGKIRLDFPITGSLENPQFSIAKLVKEALVNIVTKVVTSPFRAIASLAGKPNEDLGHIDFKPGSAKLRPSESGKLNSVAIVFGKRKVLKLDIRGVAYSQEDWPALSGEALHDKLKDMRLKELEKKGERPKAEDYELSDKEYKRLLADLFIATFPWQGKRTLFGTPTLIGEEDKDFYAVAEKKLRAQLQPEPQRLRDLAAARGQVIARYLLKQKGLAPERVFVLNPKVEPKAGKEGVSVELQLAG